MRMLPQIAAAPPISIPDIGKLDCNIDAGTKYMRFLVDEPGRDALDRNLLGFAAYNAGPNRIHRVRELAAKEGLDPNRWFDNVELMVACRIWRETVKYVSNIYKCYVAYALVTESAEAWAERVKAAQRRN